VRQVHWCQAGHERRSECLNCWLQLSIDGVVGSALRHAYCRGQSHHPRQAQEAFNPPSRFALYTRFSFMQKPDSFCKDIHILINTIHAPSIISSPASASWVPICLPRFNPRGFVNAYIEFLRREEGDDLPSKENATEANDVNSRSVNNRDPDVALVCVSGGGHFEGIRSWCASITEVTVSFTFTSDPPSLNTLSHAATGIGRHDICNHPCHTDR
jgi:hypothetical protein